MPSPPPFKKTSKIGFTLFFSLFSRFTWVMRTEAYRFTCQHAAGFNQLSGRPARVVEAHGASVQAIDQQEGQGCQQQGIVFLHGLRGNEKAPKKKGR